MSGVDTGNKRVDSLMARLSALGYICAPIKASGRRGERRRDLNCAGGDLLAWGDGMPSLLVECGGRSKNITAAFKELYRSLPPTFSPLVVLVYKRRPHYYTASGKYSNLPEALASIKES